MDIAAAEVVNQTYDVPFWENVIRLKREIKHHEKQAVAKRRLLTVAFDEICAKFVVSPLSETEK